MRGADGGPWRRICALPAYWVGLLYSETALDAAEDLTRDWTFDDVNAMRNSVPSEGFNAKIKGHNVSEIAQETLKIAKSGLKERAFLNNEGYDETHFLVPLEEILGRGTSAAEELLRAYHTRWGGSIEPLFSEQAF